MAHCTIHIIKTLNNKKQPKYNKLVCFKKSKTLVFRVPQKMWEDLQITKLLVLNIWISYTMYKMANYAKNELKTWNKNEPAETIVFPFFPIKVW